MDATSLPGDIFSAAIGELPLLTPEQEAQQAEDRFYADAQLVASYDLARQLSGHFGIREHDAWDSICTVPDNLLSLLLSPQGWTAIAGMVAADHGLIVTSFKPALH